MNERTKEGISLTVIDTMPILGTHFLRRHVPSGPFSTLQVTTIVKSGRVTKQTKEFMERYLKHFYWSSKQPWKQNHSLVEGIFLLQIIGMRFE